MGGMIIAALPFAFLFGIFSKEVEATKEVKEILIYITLIISAVFFVYVYRDILFRKRVALYCISYS